MGCSSSMKDQEMSDQAYRDYFIITSQMHSYKQEFKEVEGILKKAGEKFPEDKQIGLYRAHIKASLGKIKEAADLFSDLVTLYPKDELVLSSAAEFYFEIDRKDVAQVFYQSLKTLNPKEADYWIQEGLIFLEFGRIAEAASNFIYVADKLEKESFKGHYQLGKLYKMTGQIEKAIIAYGNCGNIAEGCVLELAQILWVLNRKKKALNKLEKFLVKKPRAVRALAALTDFYYAEGMIDEARSTLERIERVDPNNTSVTRKLAQLMIKKENYPGALDRYQMLIDTGKADERDYINLSNLYILMKDYPNAFTYIEKVKRTSPFYEDLISTKYRLYMLNNGLEMAHKYIQKEYNKKPYDQSAYVLAKSYVQKNDYKSANKVLDKTIKKSPNFVQSLYLKGLITYETGDRSKAVSYFERVLKLDPDMPSALNFVAYHLAETEQDLERAEALAQKASVLSPNEAHYVDTLGFVLYKQKKFKAALKFLEKAHKMLPSHPEIAEHLADVYVELKQQTKALQVYLLALPSLKGDNLSRVGGKIARIKSNRKLSSVTDR